MKITFLGTSHGFAEKNRFQSSTLVEVRGKSYLIDAGAPVEYQMETLGKDMTSIEAIFITHAHLDHIGCLPATIAPFLRFRYNDKCTVFMPDEIVAKAFDVWMESTTVNLEKMKSIVKFEVTKQGVVFDDGNIKVTAVPTLHMRDRSFGYIIDDGEKKVLFTGDMAGGFGEYKEVTSGSYDLIICEMAHSPIVDVWQMMAQSDTKKMIINHYSDAMIKGYEDVFVKMPFDTQLSRDGLEIIV